MGRKTNTVTWGTLKQSAGSRWNSLLVTTFVFHSHLIYCWLDILIIVALKKFYTVAAFKQQVPLIINKLLDCLDRQMESKRACEIMKKHGTSYYSLQEWCHHLFNLNLSRRAVCVFVFFGSSFSLWQLGETILCYGTVWRLKHASAVLEHLMKSVGFYESASLKQASTLVSSSFCINNIFLWRSTSDFSIYSDISLWFI